jgi:hypothetical protein
VKYLLFIKYNSSILYRRTEHQKKNFYPKKNVNNILKNYSYFTIFAMWTLVALSLNSFPRKRKIKFKRKLISSVKEAFTRWNSPRQPRFDPRSGNEIFVTDKMALEPVLPEYFCFPHNFHSITWSIYS